MSDGSQLPGSELTLQRQLRARRGIQVLNSEFRLDAVPNYLAMNSLIRRHLRARRGLQLLVKDISFSSVAKLGAAIHCVSVNSGLGGASGLGRHSAAYNRSGTMRDMPARPGIHRLTLKACSGRLIRAGAAVNCLSLLVTKCGRRCMLSASRPLQVLRALPRAPLLCRPRRERISGGGP